MKLLESYVDTNIMDIKPMRTYMFIYEQEILFDSECKWIWTPQPIWRGRYMAIQLQGRTLTKIFPHKTEKFSFATCQTSWSARWAYWRATRRARAALATSSRPCGARATSLPLAWNVWTWAWTWCQTTRARWWTCAILASPTNVCRVWVGLGGTPRLGDGCHWWSTLAIGHSWSRWINILVIGAL